MGQGELEMILHAELFFGSDSLKSDKSNWSMNKSVQVKKLVRSADIDPASTSLQTNYVIFQDRMSPASFQTVCLEKDAFCSLSARPGDTDSSVGVSQSSFGRVA